MSQTDALIRFFFKENPDNYTDEEYCKLAGQLWWALKATGNTEEKNGKITFIK